MRLPNSVSHLQEHFTFVGLQFERLAPHAQIGVECGAVACHAHHGDVGGIDADAFLASEIEFADAALAHRHAHVAVAGLDGDWACECGFSDDVDVAAVTVGDAVVDLDGAGDVSQGDFAAIVSDHRAGDRGHADVEDHRNLVERGVSREHAENALL